MTVWAVCRTPMCYESEMLTISLHKSKLGAVKAMKDFKNKRFSHWSYSPMFEKFSYHKYKIQD